MVHCHKTFTSCKIGRLNPLYNVRFFKPISFALKYLTSFVVLKIIIRYFPYNEVQYFSVTGVRDFNTENMFNE
jgi:hypothetical protein